MATFLAREPGDLDWSEVTFSSESEMNVYVKGRIDSISVGMGIDLWMNDGIVSENIEQSFNLCLSYEGAAYPIFGSVFLASRDEEGSLISLNQEQIKYLNAVSHSIELPSGLRLMHLFPDGFHQKQVEPLRALGHLLSEGVWTNNQTDHSQMKAVWKREGNINHVSNWE